MASGAQGQDKGVVFCDKCFTPSPRGREYCENCGAPLTSKRGAEGSDVVVYPQLAQVNLLRMRSRFKEAEEACLGILRQYPHNLSANTLMGDLALEQGNLDQAVQWYELALDIDPDSEAIKTKLEEASGKKEDTVVQTVVQELGLPPEKSKTLLVAIVSLVAILLLGLLAWFAYNSAKSGSETSNLNAPYVIPPDATTTSTGTSTGTTSTGTTSTGSTSTTSTGSIPDDDELTKLLASKETESAFFVRGQFDVDGITITYNAPEGKDEREIGAKLATEAFGIVKEGMQRDVGRVKLRALRASKPFYSALVMKDAYEATLSNDWQTTHKDDVAALEQAVLSDEKHSPAPTTDTGTTGADTTGTDQGTTGTGTETGTTDTASGGTTGATAGSVGGTTAATGTTPAPTTNSSSSGNPGSETTGQ